MAVQVHACLCGDWVNLNDDPDCKIGNHRSSPTVWWEENAEIWSPFKKDSENTMYQLDYVNIHYKGTDYRIHPIFIQIVST
ncbi:hypothetical protein [Paenibacillus sp. Cedars]|uniref:hypothetical protein n=1 Tax=Paenibacillus sp. Cedars TaxID=1980674 RepID=UPI001165BB95|nr:hypothetical protein [Paenibacillus sp. Cedars]AWP28752.1 hypothetical protein B9D94_19910 [Paenibacillus sp. Cedars]